MLALQNCSARPPKSTLALSVPSILRHASSRLPALSYSPRLNGVKTCSNALKALSLGAFLIPRFSDSHPARLPVLLLCKESFASQTRVRESNDASYAIGRKGHFAPACEGSRSPRNAMLIEIASRPDSRLGSVLPLFFGCSICAVDRWNYHESEYFFTRPRKSFSRQ